MRQRPQRAIGLADSRRPDRGKHGLSRAEIDVMLRAQDFKCSLCRRSIDALGAAAVDHDHDLARLHGHGEARGCPRCVRSLTCRECNLLLGYAKDDPELLRVAAAYLDAFNARRPG